MASSQNPVRVVLFTGGRGSSVLSRELIRSERIALTLAINGYDDGLSTGEVRRFLGDCLGPSDFRKNASRLATELHTCDERLVKLLDLRFPDEYGFEQARASFAQLREGGPPAADEFQRTVAEPGRRDRPSHRRPSGEPSRSLRAGACPHRVPVQLRRLQPGQSGFRRMLPRGRPRLQPRRRGLHRADGNSRRHDRKRDRRRQSLPGRGGR